jgi:hypothetical protein
MTGLDVLNRELTLPDDWHLGVGQRIRFTPTSPTHLDQPGFRDEGGYLSYPVAPVFAVSLLDRDGREWPMVADERSWNPARIELVYRLPQLFIRERRTILSMDAFVSHWTVTHTSEVTRRFWIVLWTRRPDGVDGRAIGELEANPQGISFQESVLDRSGRERARWGCAIGASFDADSWSVNGAESAGGDLSWSSTPFLDLMAPGGLPGHVPPPHSRPGHLFLALAYPFEIPPGERLVVSTAAAFAPEIELARQALERCISLIDPVQVSEEEWINWFEEAPCFTCSDRHLQRLYWYRWCQRRIWGTGIRYESIADGDGADAVATLDCGSVIEAAWQQAPELAANALYRLRELSGADLLNCAVAHAARRVFALHTDSELRCYVCSRAAEALSTLCRRVEAESPISSAELWSSLGGDVDKDTPSLRRAVFAYDLLRLARELCDDARTQYLFAQAAGVLARHLRREFWDEHEAFFMERFSGRAVKTAIGFYPLLADLADRGQRLALRNALCDPEQFWTQFPIPTLSRDDADFSADGHWQNRRLDRPMHGRVHTDVNSHLIDAFADRAELCSPADRIILTELIDRSLRLAFVERDVDRPALYEHYNPLTGQPSCYLGRSAPAGWIIDHILRYVAGIRPGVDRQLLIDPLPFPIDWFSVSRVSLGERDLEVEWDHRTGLTVRLDGEPAGHAPVGQSLTVNLTEQWVAD